MVYVYEQFNTETVIIVRLNQDTAEEIAFIAQVVAGQLQTPPTEVADQSEKVEKEPHVRQLNIQRKGLPFKTYNDLAMGN